MRFLIVITLLWWPLQVLSQDDMPPKLEPMPDVPKPPSPVKSGENLEPDITIVRKGKKIIHEYRRGGRLYMVKVIPDVGPAYYLKDMDGDGKMDVRVGDLDKGAQVNMWNLLEW